MNSQEREWLVVQVLPGEVYTGDQEGYTGGTRRDIHVGPGGIYMWDQEG